MILDEIIIRTRKRVALLPAVFPENGTCSHASLIDAIRNRESRNAVIAEIKCASPQQGHHPPERRHDNDGRNACRKGMCCSLGAD